MLFNRGDIEGTNSSNILCLMFVDVCFVSCLHRDRFCGQTSQKVHNLYEKNVKMRCAYGGVWSPCAIDRTLKSIN